METINKSNYYKIRLEDNVLKLIDKNTHLNLQNLTHEFIHVNQLDKLDPMIRLLQEQIPLMESEDGSMIIFCNSI